MTETTFKNPGRGKSKRDESSSVIDEMEKIPTSHPIDVLLWRKDEFLRMGFIESLAGFLAPTHIDLHQMEDLLKKGCSHDLALKILVGTDSWGDDRNWKFGKSVKEELKRSEELVLVK